MADRTFILFATSDGWRIATWPPSDGADVPTPANAKPAETVAAISVTLKALGYDGKPIAIGVSSAWCLSASISTAGLSRNDPKAMLYRLEENLPLAAESVVADFITSGESALGVCIKLDAIAPFVAAFEAADIAVQSIFPTALAAAQGITELAGNYILLCGETRESASPSINIIAMKDGRPIDWALVPATAADVKQQLDLLSTQLGSIPHLQAIDLDPELAEKLVEATEHVIDVDATNGSLLATRFAADVLRGRAKPWVEFRRDQLTIEDRFRLHRPWINATLVAAIALLLSLAAVFLLRAHRYRQIDKLSSGEMIAAFHEHFPGWETPVNVRAVVDAQYRRTAGGGSNLPSDQRRASALVTLHDVLIPLMTQEHVQVTRMAFHENSFEISGRLQSYEQLDSLAKLARGSGMIVIPAQTHKEPDGTWTFVLQGSKAPETRSS